jgi:L-lactate dehydrogenase complex protein LldG
MSTARDAILRRVARALADVGRDAPRARSPRRAPVEPHELADRFAERAADYRATVRRARPGAIAAAVGQALADHHARRIAVAPGLAPDWLPHGVEAVTDAATAGELDGVDGVLTGCALAVAETGTIALDGGPGQGRRALTLVPDLHVCVVQASRVVATVPEAIGLLGDAVRARRAPVTLVSGPSATSDIELRRVEGVHGPRRLEIVLVDDA